MEDCEVCKQLIKEKHRRDIWWKVFCIIFGALALILGILYFGSGSVVTKSIPDDCIAAGNPCKVIRYINDNY